jgi:hypothetical protein
MPLQTTNSDICFLASFKYRLCFVIAVVPVKDVHQVEITWMLPPLQQYYR